MIARQRLAGTGLYSAGRGGSAGEDVYSRPQLGTARASRCGSDWNSETDRPMTSRLRHDAMTSLRAFAPVQSTESTTAGPGTLALRALN